MNEKLVLILIFVTSLVLLISCKDGKSPDTVSSERGVETNTMEESKPENNTHTEGQEEHGAVGGVVTENSGTTGAASGAQMDTSGQPSGEPDNLDAMFTHLNMTNEQIQAFKNGMQDFSQSFSGNSEDERQDAIREEQKRQLQAILSPKQLEAYSEWKENK